jgi:hypothetical protein
LDKILGDILGDIMTKFWATFWAIFGQNFGRHFGRYLDKIGAFLTERLVTLLLLLVGAPSDLGAVQGDQIGRIFPIILLWAVFQKLQK